MPPIYKALLQPRNEHEKGVHSIPFLLFLHGKESMKSHSPNASSQKKLASTSPRSASCGSASMDAIFTEPWLDDACVLDMDHFVKTLAGIKAKGARPDLVGFIIAHYASKWLPELSPDASAGPTAASPEGSVAAWVKKKFLVETLAGILPPEKDAVPCGFLLRLLRAASMVGADPVYKTDVEGRVAQRLDQATLNEVMIPAFSHTSGTTLDVGLMLRLVRRFARLDEAARSGAAMFKVAKLVDSYLAEAALDAGLTVAEFEELARALPAHARATDDGLYRAIDTYIKTHPSITKLERKNLCRLIDTRKLSPEASLHATQNERLPVRVVIQVLFSENTKLSRMVDWSGSFSGARSPNPAVDLPGRCPSKREVLAQQQEMRRLREEVARLQFQCQSLQAQINRLADKKKKSLFSWTSFLFRGVDPLEDSEYDEMGVLNRTPRNAKMVRPEQERTTPKWRNSLS